MTVATKIRNVRTFTSQAYLAGLFTEMDHAQISLRIRQARKEAGYRSREDLADVMQVHPRTIENWENPKNQNVPYDRMDELADVLNVGKRWLLHGEEGSRSAVDDERLAEILLRLESLEAQVGKLATQGQVRRGLDALRAAIESQASRGSRPGTGTDG